MHRFPATIKLLVAATMAALAATACSVGSVVQAPPDDEELVRGQDLYVNNCASCHGSDGGGGRGPALRSEALLERYPTPQDTRQIIAVGRRTMPGFEGRFTEQQLDDVVRYTREVLGTAGFRE